MNPCDTKRLPWKMTHHSIFSLISLELEEIQKKQEDDPNRMRRSKFSLLCQELQKMVPNVSAKLTDETIPYIKALEETIRELVAERHKRPSVLSAQKRALAKVWAFGNKAAFFGIQSEAQQEWPTKTSKPWRPKRTARSWPPPSARLTPSEDGGRRQ